MCQLQIVIYFIFLITSQSHEILQPFVWHKLSHQHTNFCKILATLESFFFARFKRITFKLSKITNIKALFTFQWCRRIFRHGHMSKVEKNRGSIQEYLRAVRTYNFTNEKQFCGGSQQQQLLLYQRLQVHIEALKTTFITIPLL